MIVFVYAVLGCECDSVEFDDTDLWSGKLGYVCEVAE